MQAVMQSNACKMIVSKNDYMLINTIIFISLIHELTNTDSPAVPVQFCSSKMISCLLSVIDRHIDILWYLSLHCGTICDWYGRTLVACEYNVRVMNKNNNKINHIKKFWPIYTIWYGIRISDRVISRKNTDDVCLQSTFLLLNEGWYQNLWCHN